VADKPADRTFAVIERLYFRKGVRLVPEAPTLNSWFVGKQEVIQFTVDGQC
jgi:hypothetical protein